MNVIDVSDKQLSSILDKIGFLQDNCKNFMNGIFCSQFSFSLAQARSLSFNCQVIRTETSLLMYTKHSCFSCILKALLQISKLFQGKNLGAKFKGREIGTLQFVKYKNCQKLEKNRKNFTNGQNLLNIYGLESIFFKLNARIYVIRKCQTMIMI